MYVVDKRDRGISLKEYHWPNSEQLDHQNKYYSNIKHRVHYINRKLWVHREEERAENFPYSWIPNNKYGSSWSYYWQWMLDKEHSIYKVIRIISPQISSWLARGNSDTACILKTCEDPEWQKRLENSSWSKDTLKDLWQQNAVFGLRLNSESAGMEVGMLFMIALKQWQNVKIHCGLDNLLYSM